MTDDTGTPAAFAGGEDSPASIRTWLIMALVMLLATAICVSLGFWQWGRHESRQARNAVVEAAYDQAPAPLPDLFATSGADMSTIEWRPAELTGEYVGQPVLVRNRPVGLGAGFHVVGMFQQLDGSVVLVNRGYLATSLPVDQLTIPQPPAGQVTVIGRVRPAESANSHAVSGNQVYTFAPAQAAVAAGLEPATGITQESLYIVADPTLGIADSPALSNIPRPETDQGPHLSYAFQWWTFAAGIVGGFIILFVRERRPSGVTLDDVLADPAAPVTPKRQRRSKGVDESAEDDEILGQLR